ncbi:MAG: hypothetical protein NC323_08020 [Oxalobacter formigenes]|nr:hypothetical protein [Oxalobacter formigenes]
MLANPKYFSAQTVKQVTEIEQAAETGNRIANPVSTLLLLSPVATT